MSDLDRARDYLAVVIRDEAAGRPHADVTEYLALALAEVDRLTADLLYLSRMSSDQKAEVDRLNALAAAEHWAILEALSGSAHPSVDRAAVIAIVEGER